MTDRSDCGDSSLTLPHALNLTVGHSHACCSHPPLHPPLPSYDQHELIQMWCSRSQMYAEFSLSGPTPLLPQIPIYVSAFHRLSSRSSQPQPERPTEQNKQWCHWVLHEPPKRHLELLSVCCASPPTLQSRSVVVAVGTNPLFVRLGAQEAHLALFPGCPSMLPICN